MRRWAAFAAAAVVAATGAAIASAYFTTTQTSTQTIQAVPDFLPPTISSSAVYALGAPGVIPAFGYNVYAKVDDQGNPPAGVKSVTADVSSLGGPTNLALSPGAFPPGQSLYNYGSASQIASAFLPVGSSKPYTVTATDNLSQAATGNFSVLVAASCTATGLSAPNGGATVRKVDSGDVITYTFSTAIDPQSVVPGWTGAAGTLVLVSLANNGLSDDTITVIKNSTTLPLGAIDTNGSYASIGVQLVDGLLTKSGNSFKVAINGSPSNATAVFGLTAMTWTPGSGLTYNNGAACNAGPYTQSSATSNF